MYICPWTGTFINFIHFATPFLGFHNRLANNKGNYTHNRGSVFITTPPYQRHFIAKALPAQCRNKQREDIRIICSLHTINYFMMMDFYVAIDGMT